MNDRDLALALDAAKDVALKARAQMVASAGVDLPEADAALVAYRQAIALQRALETWVLDRAHRSALGNSGS